MGVLDVGPYRPRFLAATDFLGCFTHGKGEKTCCLGVEETVDEKAGVDGEEDMCDLVDEEIEEREGVEGQDVL